ncbi:GAF domain-containing sensor histidine kinase [Sphaerotilus uruguayifluvii]|uniref:histidine kinase n=1 Tax=Sphaerotilus uruguayifluvii TaxID=2735897 RepID=A0ABX2G185_9BURK|nr:ATP-binding protein [Leptothrix sp. C29]NRT56056.1 PAS domain S-box-containing protein [Leptothrix sp. C29]
MIAAPIPDDEDARLQALARCAILDTAAEPLYDELTALAARICTAPVAAITLVDRHRQWFKSRINVPVPETPRSISACAHTMLGDGPLVCEDALQDERFQGNPLVGEQRNRFYAGVPLRLSGGERLGALCVLDHRPRRLEPAQLEMLESLGRHVSRLLDQRIVASRQAEALLGSDRRVEAQAARVDESRRLLAAAEQARLALVDLLESQQQLERELREREQHFRTLADQGTALIWTAGLDMGCDYFNLPWLNFTGRTLDQELGSGWTEGVHSEDIERCLLTYKAAFAARRSFSMEYRLRAADGRYRWIRDDGSPRHDSQGGFIGFIGYCYDISDMKENEFRMRRFHAELERRVAERTADLAAANRELATFTYSVSHDLKAPLRGIDGYSRMLQLVHGDLLDDGARDLVARIRHGVGQMNQLIHDLLAYCHLEQRQVRPVPVDLLDLARRTIELRCADEPLVRSRIDLQVAPEVEAAGVLSVRADADGLAMALRNLLDNALKFSARSASPRVTVRVSSTPGDCAILSVEDNGIGFDMQYHDRIFEIFQRLERVEAYPGTGIGLAIVRKAMQRMGGRVWAEGTPGRGATFFLELPR